MSTETHFMIVSNFNIEIVRKKIKNLHLAVYPPNGKVRIAIPLAMNDDAVRLAIISHIGWIKRQKKKFQDQRRQSKREFVSGESHYFLGNRYRLQIIEQDKSNNILLQNKSKIKLIVSPNSNRDQRERVLINWYRQELKQKIPDLFNKWCSILNLINVEWRIKKMKTKWGTCNKNANRIWLNLELIKKPINCIEYIIVHELMHFKERNHNEHFLSLMDQFLPNWKLLRDELNLEPLCYEDWDY